LTPNKQAGGVTPLAGDDNKDKKGGKKEKHEKHQKEKDGQKEPGGQKDHKKAEEEKTDKNEKGNKILQGGNKVEGGQDGTETAGGKQGEHKKGTGNEETPSAQELPPVALSDGLAPIPASVGSVVLAADIKPVGCSLVFRAGPPASLWMMGTTAGNKKVPPKTPVLVVRDGKIEKTNQGVPFAFQNPKKTRVFEFTAGKELSALKTLESLIQETKATSVVKHGTWPAGRPPQDLSARLGYALAVSNATHMDALRLAKDLGAVETVWVLKFDEKERALSPFAVALITTKQLIVPASPGSLQLA
jgi:hypothetical protein